MDDWETNKHQHPGHPSYGHLDYFLINILRVAVKSPAVSL